MALKDSKIGELLNLKGDKSDSKTIAAVSGTIVMLIVLGIMCVESLTSKKLPEDDYVTASMTSETVSDDVSSKDAKSAIEEADETIITSRTSSSGNSSSGNSSSSNSSSSKSSSSKSSSSKSSSSKSSSSKSSSSKSSSSKSSSSKSSSSKSSSSRSSSSYAASSSDEVSAIRSSSSAQNTVQQEQPTEWVTVYYEEEDSGEEREPIHYDPNGPHEESGNERFNAEDKLLISEDKLHGRKAIALTFNDGPSQYTQELIEGLNAHGARATFFVLGGNADAHPDVIQMMADGGHQIGNHTYTHINMKKVTESEWKSELEKTDRAIENACGQKVTAFRPPYGSYTKDMVASIPETFTLWSVDPLDSELKDAEKVKRLIVSMCLDGSIVLLHDTYKTTVDAALDAVDELMSEGYIFVTVDELLSRYGYPTESREYYAQFPFARTQAEQPIEIEEFDPNSLTSDTDTDTETETETVTDIDKPDSDTDTQSQENSDTETDTETENVTTDNTDSVSSEQEQSDE